MALALAWHFSYAMQLYWYIVKCLIIHDTVQHFVITNRTEDQPHPCDVHLATLHGKTADHTHVHRY